MAIFHLLDRRPQIIVNEAGIFDRTTHKDFINWEIIRDAYPINIHDQKFICLVVDEQFKPSKKKGKVYRQTAKLNEAIGAQELNLSLGQININAERLTEFILLMRNATKPGKSELVKKALNEWNEKWYQCLLRRFGKTIISTLYHLSGQGLQFYDNFSQN